MNIACINELKNISKDILSDKDAEALFSAIQERARAEASQGVQNINDVLDKIGNEIIDNKEREAAILKRNAYLNVLIKHKISTTLKDFKHEAEGLRAYTGGVQSNIKNSRFSTAAVQKSQSASLVNRLTMELRKDNVMDVFKDKSVEPQIAQELFEEGSSKNPEARTIAAIIKKTYKDSIKKLNSVGAAVGELKEYIARQTHNIEKMLQTADRFSDRIADRKLAKKETSSHREAQQFLREKAFLKWKNFIAPRLDAARTFEGEDPDKFLRSVYDALVSGIHKKPPGEEDSKLFAFTGPGNRAKKLSAERVLHFKDGYNWYEYNKRYGSGSVQKSVINTLQQSGHEIGLLKMWGTNPRAMFDTISRKVLQDNRSDVDFKKIKKQVHFSDLIFRGLAGEDKAPVDNLLAKIGSSLRAIQTMAKLGGVLLSSIPDIAFKSLLMQRHGEGVLESYGNSLKAFYSGRPKGEMRLLADALGVWANSEFGHLSAYFSAADSPVGTLTKGLQNFMKLSGIEWFDEINRTSAGTAISRLLAEQKNKSFDQLHAGTRSALTLYGIESKEWDLIRNNSFKMVDGKNYITPDLARDFKDDDIANYLGKTNPSDFEKNQVKTDLEDRLLTYFIDQTDHANVQQEEADRAVVLRGTKPGTVEGELMRFIGQFKYFSIGYARRVLGRLIYGGGADNFADAILRGQGDILGLIQLIASTTILGYVSVSSKNLMRGLVPRDPTNYHTWVASLLQGGGLGIYGDFLLGEYNRFGGGLLETAAGPALGSLADAAKIFAQIREGDDPTNSTFQFVKNNMPYLNLFYTRIALDYLILYGLQERVKPGSLERMENKIQQQNNQQYWFPPSQYALRPFG